jgi:hypothetical protein
MAQVITSLTNPWVDELSFGIAKKVVLGMNWLDWVRVEPGVNGTLKLQTVTSAPLFRAGDCDMTNTGTTTFNGASLTTCQIATQESICLEALQSTYLGQYMAKTALGADTLPFQEFIMTEKAEKIQNALGKLVWRGASSSPAYASVTGNNLFCDGFLQQAYANSATTVNVQLSAWTSSNAFDFVNRAYAQIPADVKGGSPDGQLYMFVQPDDFDKYLQNRATLNLFHDAAGVISAGGKVDTIRHFGARNLTLVSTNGLDGASSGSYIITYKENIVMGTLADQDNMALDGIWDPYARVYRTVFRSKIGTQYVFPEHVVASISANYGTSA